MFFKFTELYAVFKSINLCLNVQNVISEIPKSFYLNLIKEPIKNNFAK